VARAEKKAAIRKAVKAERLAGSLRDAEAVQAAEAAEAEMFEASKREDAAFRAYDSALAAEARAALERDVAALAATGEFDPYNLARSLAAGSPGRLAARGRLVSSGRHGPTAFVALELAFWLAAGGLAEPPSPKLLTLSPYLESLYLAVRASRAIRALAAVELARGGRARRIDEALERHLDSLPGLVRAEAEAVPGRFAPFDSHIPEAPASEVFQTLLWVVESFSGWRRVALGLFHLQGLSIGETARRLKVEPNNLHAELRHGYERLAGALKAHLTRLAVARGHGLADFPGLDGLRGGRPALSPVPSLAELPDRPAPPALEPPEGSGAPSAVESESAALARRLAILSPDGLGPDLEPAYDLALALAAAGLAEPPEAERPRADPGPRHDLWGRPRPAPRRRRPIPAPARIVAPPAAEALGVLIRALEGFSDKRRLLFLLCYREGLDILEAGRRMGLSPTRARSLRVSGLKSLAAKLQEYLLDPARTPGHPAAGPPAWTPWEVIEIA
jgi:DNA-directed RNA polymerase specialized sigma24 family protein